MELTKQDSSRHWRLIDWKGSRKTREWCSLYLWPFFSPEWRCSTRTVGGGEGGALWAVLYLNLCPSLLPSHILSSFWSIHFSAKASCVAILMQNNVFDCKREKESTVGFVANYTFSTELDGKIEFCQYFPPSLCLMPIFNSSVIALYLVKRTLLLFILVFL